MKPKPPLTFYLKTIMEVCGTDIHEAKLIETVMRYDRPTLDSLDKREFNKLAKESQQALNDAELRQLVEQEI